MIKKITHFLKRRTAERKLEDLMGKYDLLEGASSEKEEKHMISFHSEFEKEVLLLLADKIAPSSNVVCTALKRGRWPRGNLMIKCTEAQALQISQECEVYQNLRKEKLRACAQRKPRRR